MKKVRAIGYGAVQISGMGPIGEAELVKILANEGLICCATHEPEELILDDTAKVIERLQKLGCRYTAYPYFESLAISFRCLQEKFTAG